MKRSGQERGALNGIIANKQLNTEKLQDLLNYTAAQDEIIKRFLATATPFQQNSLQRVLGSKEHKNIMLIRKKIKQKFARNSAVSQIKSLIGFNGIIHHLKDYKTTGNSRYLGQVNEKIVKLNQVITDLETQSLINQEDLIAINAMKN